MQIILMHIVSELAMMMTGSTFFRGQLILALSDLSELSKNNHPLVACFFLSTPL